jgi:hypothetical protein
MSQKMGLFAWLATGLLALAVPTARASDSSATAQQINDIKALYGRVAAFTQSGARPLTFELGEFRTYLADRFPTVAADDVLTPREGPSITLRRRVTRSTSVAGSRVRVTYDAGWNPAAPTTTDAQRTASTATLWDLLLALSAQRPGLSVTEIQSVTCFHVRAQLDKTFISYDAAVVWLGPGDASAAAKTSGNTGFVVLDNVTLGLDALALDPSAPPTAMATVETMGPGLMTSEASAPTCVAESTQRYHFSLVDHLDRTEHDLQLNPEGSHSLRPDFTASCNCSASCVASGDVENLSSCEEGGLVTGQGHKTGSARDLKIANVSYPDSLSRGASLSAAFGCAVRACGSCSVSASISITGSGGGAGGTVGVTWTPDAQAIWNDHMEVSHPCPPCRLAKKKVRKSLLEGTNCEVSVECYDAGPGEEGYDTCDEAAEAVPDPECNPDGGGGGGDPGDGEGGGGGGGSPCPPGQQLYAIDCYGDGSIDGYTCAWDSEDACEITSDFCGNGFPCVPAIMSTETATRDSLMAPASLGNAFRPTKAPQD